MSDNIPETAADDVVDLDKARAARREAAGRGPIIRVGGVEYELPAEMPFSVLEPLRGMANEETAAAAMVDMTRALLGEHYEAIRDAGLSTEDLNVLIEGVMAKYGVQRPLASSVS